MTTLPTILDNKVYTSHNGDFDLKDFNRKLSITEALANKMSHSSDSANRDEAKKMMNFPMVLFSMLAGNDNEVSVKKFIKALRQTGLREDDPRLRKCMEKITATEKDSLDRETFTDCIQENIVVISAAFKNEHIIPDWQKFTDDIDGLYWKCKKNNSGHVASYIPQLARSDPNFWGVSVCTVDGQRHSIGDTNRKFCLQSTSKPLSYAVALSELGVDEVHQYVGQEPSGRSFNELSLNNNHKPHNPMINSGAIVTISLIKRKNPLSERFEHLIKEYNRLAGYEYVGFDNPVFLSERDTADRNFALGYYMKENKCFPEESKLHETLDLYFQACSCDINCDSGAVIAATLANGGICPTTDEVVLDPVAVRNTLSLMHSCGMYDYSGQFAFKVGLPAKSGVSGVVLLVVPNVMGICMWSPPLDQWGNSVKGIEFCESLVELYNFHNYDNLKNTNQKLDPRKRESENKAQEVVNLLFSAYNGDVTAIRRYVLKGMDMGQADYDGRTALHLAAAEGHLDCVEFLLETCGLNPCPKDRWGHTPADDAKQFNHLDVLDCINKYSKRIEEERSE